MPNAQNLVGNKFGRLTALSPAQRHAKTGRTMWNCRCQCGNEVVVFSCNLKNGTSQSCGCLHKELASQRATTHGHCRNGITSKERSTWNSMKTRCYNKNRPDYINYGKRGIKVCARWLHSFENFLTDMGTAPSVHHSIERVDNDGDYSPKNCVWATKKEQSLNTRVNRMLTFRGKTMTATEWSGELGLKFGTIINRIDNLGWSVESALTKTARDWGR